MKKREVGYYLNPMTMKSNFVESVECSVLKGKAITPLGALILLGFYNFAFDFFSQRADMQRDPRQPGSPPVFQPRPQILFETQTNGAIFNLFLTLEFPHKEKVKALSRYGHKKNTFFSCRSNFSGK